MKDKLLILAGPTGVGKSKLSIKVAKRLNGEIISADSMQVYKLMDIGSAKISKEEMEGVKHHLIDVCYPDCVFNVAIYVKLAKEKIKDITSRGKLPIVVGGTGMYIRSLIYNQKHCDAKEDKEYRDFLYNKAQENGNKYVHNLLKEVDIDSYNNIHFNNLKRVIRALEVYRSTGKPFSSFKCDKEAIYDFKYFMLNIDRGKLYGGINKRVNCMIEDGLIDEVKKLRELGYTRSMQSMQGIGYKEVFDYLDGVLTKDEMIEKIKKESRNYAKRQLTWFKKEEDIIYLSKDEMSEQEILEYILYEFNRS